MKMSIILLLLLFLIGLTTTAEGSHYYNGYYSNGYYYYNGYWYYGNTGPPYSRTQYYYNGYWQCGIYYPGYYYYYYYRYYPPVSTPTYTTPTYTTVNYTDDNWRSRLLDIAKQRDRVEGEIRKKAYEQQYFSESVKLLGLEGNFTWQGYGAVPPYSYNNKYGAQYVPPVQGSTLYGYSYNTIAQLYGDTNLTTLYQQAQQLAQGSQKLAGDATRDFTALIGTEGTSRAKVAEILAKGQMAEKIILALRSPSTVETKGYAFKVTPQGVIQKTENGVDPVARATFNQQFAILTEMKCAECHNSSKKKGGFDVSLYPSLSPAEKQAVWHRLTTDDPKIMMPRAADGGPGTKLTQEELRLFLVN